jgi:hypothetical protein
MENINLRLEKINGNEITILEGQALAPVAPKKIVISGDIKTTASFIEKRTATQQLIWQKIFAGDITIKDMEFNSQQHVIVIGSYDSTITLDGITLSSSPFYKSTFLYEEKIW